MVDTPNALDDVQRARRGRLHDVPLSSFRRALRTEGDLDNEMGVAQFAAYLLSGNPNETAVDAVGTLNLLAYVSRSSPAEGLPWEKELLTYLAPADRRAASRAQYHLVGPSLFATLGQRDVLFRALSRFPHPWEFRELAWIDRAGLPPTRELGGLWRWSEWVLENDGEDCVSITRCRAHALHPDSESFIVSHIRETAARYPTAQPQATSPWLAEADRLQRLTELCNHQDPEVAGVALESLAAHLRDPSKLRDASTHDCLQRAMLRFTSMRAEQDSFGAWHLLAAIDCPSAVSVPLLLEQYHALSDDSRAYYGRLFQAALLACGSTMHLALPSLSTYSLPAKSPEECARIRQNITSLITQGRTDIVACELWKLPVAERPIVASSQVTFADPDIRFAYVNMLVGCRAQDALLAVASFLSDEDTTIRDLASFSIEQALDRTRPIEHRRSRDDEEEAEDSSLELPANGRRYAALTPWERQIADAAHRQCRDPDGVVRGQCLKILANLGDERAEEAILEFFAEYRLDWFASDVATVCARASFVGMIREKRDQNEYEAKTALRHLDEALRTRPRSANLPRHASRLSRSTPQKRRRRPVYFPPADLSWVPEKR